MLFKFPLPGPLKGKLLPKEGLDGDRLRAGWVRAGVPGLGSGLGFGSGFRAGVPSWGWFLVWVPGLGFRAGVSGRPGFRAWVLREKLRFGAGWAPGWIPGLAWISGWSGFRAGLGSGLG